MRLLVNQWRFLPDDEKEKYEYRSDETGCYFTLKKEESDDSNEVVDDFERLMKGESN